MSQICGYHNLKICTPKTRMMEFCSKKSMRNKLIITSEPVEQDSEFNYPGCNISFNYEMDINSKLSKCLSISGVIRRSLQERTGRKALLKFYNIMAVPLLLIVVECRC